MSEKERPEEGRFRGRRAYGADPQREAWMTLEVSVRSLQP